MYCEHAQHNGMQCDPGAFCQRTELHHAERVRGWAGTAQKEDFDLHFCSLFVYSIFFCAMVGLPKDVLLRRRDLGMIIMGGCEHILD
jgi:hypothetical protein